MFSLKVTKEYTYKSYICICDTYKTIFIGFLHKIMNLIISINESSHLMFLVFIRILRVLNFDLQVTDLIFRRAVLPSTPFNDDLILIIFLQILFLCQPAHHHFFPLISVSWFSAHLSRFI